MRLLHITQDLGVGGIERLLEGLLPRLRDLGHEVELFCLWGEGPIADSIREKGVNVSHLSLRSYWNPGQVYALHRKIRMAKPSLVHAHGSFANIFSGFSGRLPSSPPVLLHNHTQWMSRHPRRQVLAERWAARGAARVLCVSRAVADSVVGASLSPPQKVRVIYNGVDLDSYPLQERYTTDKLVCVGSLESHKGHDVLIRAMMIVREHMPGALLTLVGGGSRRAALENLAGELGLADAVEFTGVVTRVQDYLYDAGLFVLPSLEREGLGIALLEAMASGLPVIASQCGGVLEVIENGVSGLLVESGDSTALAMAIVQLMGDRELSDRLAAKGRARVEERFSLEKTCQALLSVYEEVLDE